MNTIIEHPIVTEQAMNEMDFKNKLLFLVDIDATKPEVREEVQDRYDVSVTDVNTQVTPQGAKKATVTLSADDDATENASRIGSFSDGPTSRRTAAPTRRPDAPGPLPPLQGGPVAQEAHRR